MKKSILTNAAKLIEFLRSVNFIGSDEQDDASLFELQEDTQMLACTTTIIDLRAEKKRARRTR